MRKALGARCLHSRVTVAPPLATRKRMPPRPQILIVDDNPDHRLILTYQLAKIGPFAISEAGDGQQALARMAAAPPDLIFMNLGLPVLDGWEAIRRIRALPAPLGQAPI